MIKIDKVQRRRMTSESMLVAVGGNGRSYRKITGLLEGGVRK